MIHIKLSRMAGDRRVKIKDLMEATGKTRPTIAALWYDRAKSIDINVLNSLCEYLDCLPQDLIEYIPDNDEKTGE